MNARQKSIKILQDAVKNKTLGAYKGAMVCRYYDKATDSCCAVGALIPREELMQNVDKHGDVESLGFEGLGAIGDALTYGKWKNNTGLTNVELIHLQREHDDVVDEYGDIETFESFVASLV